MTLDTAKLNITERDIEDWLYANPTFVATEMTHKVIRWIARQYKLPSGIADLVGMDSMGYVVVVEVKNVPIDARAITQVCRYAADIEDVLEYRGHYKWHTEIGAAIQKIVIGPAVESDTILLEAQACQVNLRKFTVSLQLAAARFVHGGKEDETIDELLERVGYRDQQLRTLAKGSEWDVAGPLEDTWSLLREDLEEERRREFLIEMFSDAGDVEHF